MSKRHGLFASLYQLAGELLLAGDSLTPGQRDRLRELLLDVLSQPDQFTSKGVDNIRRLAKLP